MPSARAARGRAVTRVVFGCYLVVLGYLVFTPQPDDHRAFGWVRRTIDWVAAHGLPLTFAVAEAIGNVLLFVPFGLLLGGLLGLRRWWLVWLVGSATSAAIETIQLAIPGRWTTLQDWILNTLGTALGLAVLVLVAPRTRTAAEATARAQPPSASA
ncbi:VanZ family protein [Cellulomonas sp. 73-92]|uniref:VanZ family protein n=1 Tax=Cellulomonas sp. 73-92 TaxID=1895740 RepID=UPI0025B7B308|nr:VanZ family protein [Cellulomonas sp. 73-92]